MDYHIVFSLLGSFVGIVSYIPYLRDVIRRRTKPHPFSWFVWGLIITIVFFAQIAEGGGVGIWVTGVSALAGFTVFFFSLFRGEDGITKSDWLCFIGALCGVLFWRITGSALTAVVIVTITDALAFIPTMRKAYSKPEEETVSTFAMSAIKWVLALIALESFNLTTVLHPASLVVSNSVFVGMVLMRRRTLTHSALVSRTV